MLSVVALDIAMLSVIMLNVAIFNVIMLSVVLLNIVAHVSNLDSNFCNAQIRAKCYET